MQDANDQWRAPFGIVDDDIWEAGQRYEPVRFPGQFRTQRADMDMFDNALRRPDHPVAQGPRGAWVVLGDPPYGSQS